MPIIHQGVKKWALISKSWSEENCSKFSVVQFSSINSSIN